MKTWLFATIFFTLGIVSQVSAMLDGNKEINLDELNKLSQSIPCLRPVVALLPEFMAYQNLMMQGPRESGAYIIDHAHRQIYMPQHIIEQIPFLAASQSFERRQQKDNDKSTLTIKLDHPDLEAALLSWLSEIIQQDLHKVDKAARLHSLMERKLPTKKKIKAIKDKLEMPDLANALEEASNKKNQAKKKEANDKAMAQLQSNKNDTAGVWELHGSLKIPKAEIIKGFKDAPYQIYYTKDIRINDTDMLFSFERRADKLSIFLRSKTSDVFMEWSGEFEGISLSTTVQHYTTEGWGKLEVMKIDDLNSIKKPKLIFKFHIKMVVD